MKNYINYAGEISKSKPEELVEIKDCYTGTICKFYKVIVYREDCLIDSEYFTTEPTDGNILWAICKHNGDSAEVRTIFEPELNI